MNYYDILQVSENASDEIIKNSYKFLAKKYHPDTFNGDKNYAESNMKSINEAYTVLSNPIKRREYDLSLKNSIKKDFNNINSTDDDDDYNVKEENQKKSIGCFGCLGWIFKLFIIIALLSGVKEAIFPSESPSEVANVNNNKVVQEKTSSSNNDSNKSKIDYDSEIKKYVLGTGNYLDLYTQKYNISLNKFDSKKKTIEKHEEILRDINSKKLKPQYMELEPQIFKNKNYKLTMNQTDLIYFGELKDNKPHGIGVLFQNVVFNNNIYVTTKYIGNFKDGLFDGFGILNHVPTDDELYYAPQVYGDNINIIINRFNYEEYEGEFDEGDISGSGNVFVYPTLKSELNLKGIEIYSPIKGSSMEVDTHAEPNHITVITGEFKKNKLNGKGICYISGFKSYEGEYINSNFNGKGTLYFDKSQQVQYKGEFKDNKYNGKGTLYDETGNTIYSGEWNMGGYK